MAKVTVSLPQGTRDFGPDVVRKRNYIFNTIKNVFELYGFEPLETPAMENLDTLMGKYGEEGDRLIFKILNNGLNDARNIEKARTAFENILQGKNSKDITERALKYDLTIPFARYVAMNSGQLTFPFKRYQIQPVWRADRPQKGRYREFFQCDADVVGSNSLLNEIELANIYATVFEKLGIDFEIRINSRKLLAGVAEAIGAPEKIIDMTIAIDKFDKIGLDGVKQELHNKEFSDSQISDLTDFIFASANKVTAKDVQLKDSEAFTMHSLKNAAPKFLSNKNFMKGIAEVEEVFEKSKFANPKSKIQIDLTLARGLNYYTGIIFEVKAKGIQMGSIGGGGRYDDLTGLFGVPNIPGVGISFGVDRIYDVMEELKLFPEEVHTGTQVLFFNLGEEESKASFSLVQQLRANNIRCELYHETSKFDKQFKYAEKKNIPYAVIIGSKELLEKTAVIKNLRSGNQQTIPIDDLKNYSFI
jgi:histidyl-tRNA synthetase